MSIANITAAFSALAQETRLLLLQELAKAGPDGLAAGAAADRLDVSASNLSFHLKELQRAGLISARRQGRAIFYAANEAALGDLVKFMFENLQAARPRVRVSAERP
jgi:ArsR family transcriptional regulator